MSLSLSGNTTKGRWLLLIVWICVIFSFSTDSFSASKTSTFIVPALKFLFPFLSPQQLEFGHLVCRKAGHVSEYFVLGVLAWRALRVDSHDAPKAWLLAAFLVLVIALTDEFHQSFVPSRTSSLMDVGYDFIGGIIALGVLSRFRHENRALYSHSVL